jgi:hypothetical protein
MQIHHAAEREQQLSELPVVPPVPTVAALSSPAWAAPPQQSTMPLWLSVIA